MAAGLGERETTAPATTPTSADDASIRSTGAVTGDIQRLHEEEALAALDVVRLLSLDIGGGLLDGSAGDSIGVSTVTGIEREGPDDEYDEYETDLDSIDTGHEGGYGEGIMPQQRPPSMRDRGGRRALGRSGGGAGGRTQQEGVLWKRRDVFKNQWRPRWFVLNARQATLTYYLLANDGSNVVHDNRDSSGGRSSNGGATTATRPESSSETFPPQSPPFPASPLSNRRRTLSESSTESVHYDVVPRGSIIVRPRRFVGVNNNEKLTAPQDQLFAFTVTLAHPTERCHLAAPTAAERDAWVEAIRRVGGGIQRASASNGDLMRASSASVESNTMYDSERTFDSFTGSLDLEPFPLSEHEELHDGSQGDSSAEVPVQSQAQSQQRHQVDTPTRSGRQQQESHSPSQQNSDFYRDVPSEIANHAEEIINKYLPLCDEHDDSASDWTQVMTMSEQEDEDTPTDVPPEHRFSVRAWTRQNPNRPSLQLLKTTAIMSLPATNMAHLLLDCRLRGDLEPNLARDSTKRVRAYNSHSFLDYYAYLSVWPTSPRDFAVAVHWRVLHLSNAICIVAFSRSEAGPPLQSHVRADLEISMYLLQPIGDLGQCTRATRLLSYDLKGHIPRQLANGVLQQQAAMPGVIYQYLRQPRMQNRFKTTTVSNAAIVRDIVLPMTASMRLDRSIISDGLAHELDQHYRARPKKRNGTKRGQSRSVSKTRKEPNKEIPKHQSHLVRSAFILVFPVVIHESMRQRGIPYREVAFVIATLLAIRTIVLDHLGPPLSNRTSNSSAQHQQNSMTAKFTVDLKGVLRYIANAHAERTDIINSDVTDDLSVTHIVVCALARALVTHRDELLAQRTRIPWLGIDGYFSKASGSASIKVGITMASGKQLIVERADQCSVADIARIMASQAKDTAATSDAPWWSSILPLPRDTVDCLVLTTPDTNNHCEVDIDVTATDDDIPVALVVSGVRLATSSKKSHRPKKHPTLHMSLTVRHAELPTCRLLAESVQKLVSFPELCDDGEVSS